MDSKVKEAKPAHKSFKNADAEVLSGESDKATGRKKSLDKHPGPRIEDKDHFSAMKVVDSKEGYAATMKNMKAPLVGGPIKSLVGDGIKAGRVPGTAHGDDFDYSPARKKKGPDLGNGGKGSYSTDRFKEDSD